MNDSRSTQQATSDPKKAEDPNRAQRIWRVLTPLMAVALLAAIIYFFGIRPISQINAMKNCLETKDFLQLKANTLTGLAQALGGAILLIGLFFTWRTVRATEANVRITQESTARNLAIAQESQLTDRFIRATELLGNNQSLAMRLGGIYSLERIARDSTKDYWTAMEILTAFVRVKSEWKETARNEPFKLRDDVQAILTVLGRRNLEYERHENRRLSLYGSDLRGAKLDKAIFGGLDLTLAHLEGASLLDTDFQNAQFFGAHLAGAHLERAHLERADFRSAKLNGVFLDHARLDEANFQQARLTDAKLNYATVELAKFEYANLERAELSNASLERTTFAFANLNRAVLFKANFHEASVIDSSMREATLFDAKLDRASFMRVDFQGAKGLNVEQIRSAACESCQFPPELVAALSQPVEKQ